MKGFLFSSLDFAGWLQSIECYLFLPQQIRGLQSISLFIQDSVGETACLVEIISIQFQNFLSRTNADKTYMILQRFFFLDMKEQKLSEVSTGIK